MSSAVVVEEVEGVEEGEGWGEGWGEGGRREKVAWCGVGVEVGGEHAGAAATCSVILRNDRSSTTLCCYIFCCYISLSALRLRLRLKQRRTEGERETWSGLNEQRAEELEQDVGGSTTAVLLSSIVDQQAAAATQSATRQCDHLRATNPAMGQTDTPAESARNMWPRYLLSVSLSVSVGKSIFHSNSTLTGSAWHSAVSALPALLS